MKFWLRSLICSWPVVSSTLCFATWRKHRRATMQLNLVFADLPEPEDSLWAQIDEPLREAAIGQLAQLMTKAVIAETQARERNDD
jgi:translation initiation factor 2 alpha subunit (eIF-2alpha)